MIGVRCPTQLWRSHGTHTCAHCRRRQTTVILSIHPAYSRCHCINTVALCTVSAWHNASRQLHQKLGQARTQFCREACVKWQVTHSHSSCTPNLRGSEKAWQNLVAAQQTQHMQSGMVQARECISAMCSGFPQQFWLLGSAGQSADAALQSTPPQTRLAMTYAVCASTFC